MTSSELRQPWNEPGERSDGPDSRSSALMETLFREHNQGLVRFLAARLSSDAEAREVAQEAYVRLLQLHQPGATGFLRALLYKTAHHIAIDRIRKRRLEREFRDNLPFDFELDRRSPETQAASVEDIGIVAGCLDELSPRCRQAVLLSRVQGSSSAEIAAVLGVTPRMVRMYLTEALLLIRDRLAKAHGGPRPGPGERGAGS